MRALFLDCGFGYEPAKSARFSSSVSCFDYDVVVWDPRFSLYDYQSSLAQHRGLPSLDEHDSVRIVADVKRRRKEFDEFLNSGHTVIVFVGPPERCFYDTGNRKYSGTGRNRSTTNMVAELDLWAAVPGDPKPEPASGRSIQFVGDQRAARFWQDNRENLTYSAILKSHPGQPLFVISDTKQVVGSIHHTNAGGILMLLPVPFFDDVDVEDDSNDDGLGEQSKHGEDRVRRFQQSIIDLVSGFRSNGDFEAPPDWAPLYMTDGEDVLRDVVTAAERAVSNAHARLADRKSELAEVESRKRLFTGSGRALEIEVKKVFEALGCEVHEAELGRDDWRVVFPEGPAVVEVKGVTGSAAENHAAQLEKWVSLYAEENDVFPKGILVVNAYRNKPLSERSDVAFPDQMLTYSKARGHCLITGLQLLGIWQDVRRKPERAGYWRKKLMSTSGPLPQLIDWSKYVTHQAATTASVNDGR